MWMAVYLHLPVQSALVTDKVVSLLATMVKCT